MAAPPFGTCCLVLLLHAAFLLIVQIRFFATITLLDLSHVSGVGNVADGNVTAIIASPSQNAVSESMMNKQIRQRSRMIRNCTDPELVCQQIARWKAKYDGPPNTISIADRIDCLLEAEDKRGRFWRCLGIYFEAYRKEVPFSGELFFDWLDRGRGRDVNLNRSGGKKKGKARCGRGEGRYSLNAKHMMYFSDEEKRHLAVRFELEFVKRSVRVVLNSTGLPLPAGKFLFVWSVDKKVHVAAEQKGVVAHTSFGRAMPVLHAGEFVIKNNGTLAEVRPNSGHYHPKKESYKRFRSWLEGELGLGRGIDLSLRWEHREEWYMEVSLVVNKKIEYM